VKPIENGGPEVQEALKGRNNILGEMLNNVHVAQECDATKMSSELKAQFQKCISKHKGFIRINWKL